MRHHRAQTVSAIVAVAIAILLTGCVLKGKPKVVSAAPPVPKPVAAPAPPAAPPAPLSSLQTHADLPAPQPISNEAMETTEAPGEPSPPPPSPPKSARKGSRPPPVQAPKPAESAAPAAATPAPTPPAAATAEPERPPIQEIVPDEERNRLQLGADAKKAEIKDRLGRLPKRRQSAEEKAVVENIQSFVKLSDDAERSGDMRKAYELADRGLVLAQGLTNAK